MPAYYCLVCPLFIPASGPAVVLPLTTNNLPQNEDRALPSAKSVGAMPAKDSSAKVSRGLPLPGVLRSTVHAAEPLSQPHPGRQQQQHKLRQQQEQQGSEEASGKKAPASQGIKAAQVPAGSWSASAELWGDRDRRLSLPPALLGGDETEFIHLMVHHASAIYVEDTAALSAWNCSRCRLPWVHDFELTSLIVDTDALLEVRPCAAHSRAPSLAFAGTD